MSPRPFELSFNFSQYPLPLRRLFFPLPSCQSPSFALPRQTLYPSILRLSFSLRPSTSDPWTRLNAPPGPRFIAMDHRPLRTHHAASLSSGPLAVPSISLLLQLFTVGPPNLPSCLSLPLSSPWCPASTSHILVSVHITLAFIVQTNSLEAILGHHLPSTLALIKNMVDNGIIGTLLCSLNQCSCR